jgi:membrane associated rhomboid family serine protease
MTSVTYKKAGIHNLGITKLISNPELLFVYLGVPMSLVFIYLLPTSIKTQFFTLHLESPTAFSLLTSAFSHNLYSHLSNNLVYYLIAITAILIMETNIRRFRYVMLLSFTLVPVITSAASFVYFSGGVYTQMLGFSCIGTALIGYVVYLIVEKMYQVTPVARPHAFLLWISAAATIVFFVGLSLGAISIYQAGHLSNGVGHLVGYMLGLILAYLFR